MADQKPQSGTIDLRTTGGTAQTGQATAVKTGKTANPTGDDLFNKFDIPETVRAQYPDLIPLILETESMNDDERQYWFQILPIMTEEQVTKLKEILLNEKKQLADLDRQYETDMKKINTKHVSQWKAFEAAEKRKQLKSAETAAEHGEKTTEEELLQKLQGI